MGILSKIHDAPRRWPCFLAVCIGVSLSNRFVSAEEASGACQRTARYALKGCRSEALDDFYLAMGNCENLTSRQERMECRKDAKESLREAHDDCAEQHDERDDVCDLLGSGAYDPEINPGDFASGITNPYFPLVPGTKFIYESEKDEGLERVEIEVTHETRVILGVTCTVVHDVEFLNGEIVEDTVDWFAQDKAGNVWYFGELSLEFEDGQLIGIEGSWEAGVDSAKPGIVMKANPQVGDAYRQEFLLGEAEDMGKVIALGQSVSVPFGSLTGCVQTKDFTPLEPNALEHKYYAPGLGKVLEVNVRTGRRTELVEILKE